MLIPLAAVLFFSVIGATAITVYMVGRVFVNNITGMVRITKARPQGWTLWDQTVSLTIGMIVLIGTSSFFALIVTALIVSVRITS